MVGIWWILNTWRSESSRVIAKVRKVEGGLSFFWSQQPVMVMGPLGTPPDRKPTPGLVQLVQLGSRRWPELRWRWSRPKGAPPRVEFHSWHWEWIQPLGRYQESRDAHQFNLLRMWWIFCHTIPYILTGSRWEERRKQHRNQHVRGVREILLLLDTASASFPHCKPGDRWLLLTDPGWNGGDEPGEAASCSCTLGRLKTWKTGKRIERSYT